MFLLVFLGLLTAFGPFVTNMYLPALPSMVNWFDTSTSLVQFSLTSCMVGLAVGQLLFGPMSNRYGRKPVLLWTLLFFILSTLLCLFSNHIYVFVIFRLLQGISAAGSIVIARSISTDLFAGRELVRILAIVGSINGIAPVLARNLYYPVIYWHTVVIRLSVLSRIYTRGETCFIQSLKFTVILHTFIEKPSLHGVYVAAWVFPSCTFCQYCFRSLHHAAALWVYSV